MTGHDSLASTKISEEWLNSHWHTPCKSNCTSPETAERLDHHASHDLRHPGFCTVGLNCVMIKILLVDDEQSVLVALRRFLRRKGFEVEVAQNGQEALDSLDRIRPDVVVSDFKMPGMNGAQLLATVAQRFPSARRIMLSGCAEVPLGVDAVFLPKPWDDDELLLHCGKGSLP